MKESRTQKSKTTIGISARNGPTLEMLREQELRYREAEKIGHMGSWERDLSTNQLIWSEELFRIYGLKPGEKELTTDFFINEIVHPEDRKMVRRHIRSIYREHREVPMEYRIITPAGERMVFSKPQVTKKGKKVTAIRGIVQDITAQKKAELEINKLKLQQQNQILSAILQAQEAERIRIGEALHNGVGQLLYAIKLKLDAVEQDQSGTIVRDIAQILKDAISETRNISFTLVPTVLKDFGLSTAVKDLMVRSDSEKIKIKFNVKGSKKRLPEEFEVGVFRIIQELLNNVIRHSKADKASLSILHKNDSLTICLQDNGLGFNVEKNLQKGKGFGLRNIKSRVQLFNGSLKIKSDNLKGTRIKIVFPLASRTHHSFV